MPGYGSQQYAGSFAALGQLIRLPNSGINLLKRPIDSEHFDCSGLYPFVVSDSWPEVDRDLDQLRASGAVSLVFVADPFAYDQVSAVTADWELCRPFKTHFVVDLHQDWRQQQSRNTRKACRRGRRLNDVVKVKNTREFSSEFFAMYRHSMGRLNAGPLQRLSQSAITQQAGVAGSFVLAAYSENRLMGAMICYDHGSYGNLHLVALGSGAHRLNTSYALVTGALEEFEQLGERWVNLGGNAGAADQPGGGLYKFKQRWANTRRHSLLCGKILDPVRYEWLTRQCGTQANGYMPSYRVPGGRYEWNPSWPDDATNP